MLLFVLATDIVSQKITHSHLLHGVTLSQSSLKILQFTDDNTILLTASDSILALKEILTQFSTHANLEINQIKRSKLVKNHKDGGLRFPDIQSKIKAAFMMKLLLTIQNKMRDHFFIAYIMYNLNIKLTPYNKTLYQRNSINHLFPNHYWEKTVNLLEPIFKHQTDWQELNFQSIYWIL